MAFSQSFLVELIARKDITDVVSGYVNLTKKGGNFFGLCPFHNEKTGSFSVSPDKQIYHCFGCKKGGGVINFVMEMENFSFPEAVEFLAKRVNLPLPEQGKGSDDSLRRRILALNRDAARFFYETLQTPEGAAVAKYLENRKISRKTAVNFGLGAAQDKWDALLQAMTRKGYAKSELLSAGLVVQGKNGNLYDKFRNRLIFPVIDNRGDVVAFGGRIISKDDPGAKYMNSPETVVYSKRRVLYGLNLAKKSKRGNIILCEGNIDVVMLHQAGFDNAVASMGTALTQEQTRLLSRCTKELILCYDNDDAGKIATQKALAILQDSEFNVKVLQLPKRFVDGEYVKQDADDFIKYQGREAFERLLSGSADGMDFRMEQVAARFDLSDDKQKVEYAAAVSELIATLSNAVEREVYTARAAALCSVTPQALALDVQRARKRLFTKADRMQRRADLNPIAQVQPKLRTVRYDNVRSAMAEEGVIRLLTLDESLFGEVETLSSSEFSCQLLGRVFDALLSQKNDGHISVPLLARELSGEEMSHVSQLLQKPESAANAHRALRDYITLIKEEAQKRSGAGYDPLAAAVEKYKSKKGHGGK